MSINKVTIVGNLGANPETKTFQDGGSLTNVNIYTDESYKDQNGNKVESNQIHRVVFRGKVSDIAAKYLKKGSKVYIEGKLNHRSFVNKDNITQYVTEVVVAGYQGVLQMLDKAPAQQEQPQIPQHMIDQPF
jgi:single-strand DNA-binding protein